MRVLLVYPETPSTFYGFRHALRFISKKADGPPLGLLTVAAMLPGEWEKKLIDMNVAPLRDKDILWADYVFVSGMNIQKASFKDVIKRCNELGVKVVAGGPMATIEHEEFDGVDHFVLNEAEITLPMFLEDLKSGSPKHMYTSSKFPDISLTPVPLWDLLDMKAYATMYLQYSRGCPFNCEFCSVTMLNGHKPRTKSKEQFLAELQSLYELGWRGGIFVVDDNFIGNKKKLKAEMLPALIDWGRRRSYPFEFTTEASINLADDPELVQLMVEAGFHSVFTGIETPNDESLAECGKSQNLHRDLLGSVRFLQRRGLRVSAGFIVGFDHDSPGIFEQMVNFIQKSGIVTAMVGLLNAPPGTRLFQRLKSENRLLNLASGDNMDGSMNFVPKMDYERLKRGYREILENIYSHKQYYERVKTLLREYNPQLKKPRRVTLQDVKAILRSVWVLGVVEKGKRYYWQLFFLSLFKYRRKFSLAMMMAVYGLHFRRIVDAIRRSSLA
ncbi:MAG: DUF4070 domain-containing protein [Deltaproteobacteria bacterium]|nr:DUF4070 domain-containing protein [Deltaproteobacteria bacterium]MBW1920792.1 DUF4070 domain-containing protein [Deltaproteobacteria bacterium]MBW1935478.1 DUF4070 domain-containing protein [Deltaproteobacteria bacterium]MBW1977458.1 DUF4070 domain-containing protein [Deltaproteobacteria bacterium]MBW2043490.1 DUF4070 domain-containing protein [Deltaproteobacteria bacterium]